MVRRFFLLLMLAVSALPWDARAQDTGSAATSATDAATDAWIVTLGGSFTLGPSYEGARSIAPFFTPSFDIRRADEPATFGAPDDNFGIGLFDLGAFKLGPLAGIREGRASGALPGLPGYAWALEGGAFAEYWPVDGMLRTRVELLQGFGASGGLAANLSADFVQKQGVFTWSIGPRLSLADSALMQTEFGVSPLASALNGHIAPYAPDAGIKSLGLTSSLSYEMSQDWTTTLYGSYQRLTGAAATSPVTTLAGSPNQITVGLGFEHSFVLGRP
ncbi:MipA/OmpV family protein [Xanthobacter versatilis]|uniref:MipA/OmpV family protein n=1 Tax=Xanthobacter autotrophicus (strain ATCC BAA-1158 / Py2) TaxID=78245 RepID=UPI0037292878